MWWTYLNSMFEAVAAVLAWREVAALRRARNPEGVYWPRFALTAAWGASCIGYYLEHGDRLSLVGAAVRDVAVLAWLWVYYDRRCRGSGPR